MMFALFALALSAPLISLHEEKSFISWMRATNQLFVGDEYQLRFGIWLAKKEYVQSVNAAHRGFTVSLNKFAAYTPAEYKALRDLKMVLKIRHVKKAKFQSDAPVD
jgi:cathepsin L